MVFYYVFFVKLNSFVTYNNFKIFFFNATTRREKNCLITKISHLRRQRHLKNVRAFFHTIDFYPSKFNHEMQTHTQYGNTQKTDIFVVTNRFYFSSFFSLLTFLFDKNFVTLHSFARQSCVATEVREL